VHTTKISLADRAALENLWGDAGTWAADTWTALNTEHFDGRVRYHGIVWGLTPHGRNLGYTSNPRRITLHPALLDPRGDAWAISSQLGTRHAADVLLHEMVHVALFAPGVDNPDSTPYHNTAEWCAEIVRITPQLGLPPIKAAPVKPRRVDGKVVRQPLDGYLSRSDIAHWPHSLRPAGYYVADAEPIAVPI
jgi:hypothetical protein